MQIMGVIALIRHDEFPRTQPPQDREIKNVGEGVLNKDDIDLVFSEETVQSIQRKWEKQTK